MMAEFAVWNDAYKRAAYVWYIASEDRMDVFGYDTHMKLMSALHAGALTVPEAFVYLGEL